MSTELKPGETDKLWTISNIITLVRICLVPVFVVALITPWPTWFSITGVSSTTKSLIAALIFILISCTDWLDGYLAPATTIRPRTSASSWIRSRTRFSFARRFSRWLS